MSAGNADAVVNLGPNKERLLGEVREMARARGQHVLVHYAQRPDNIPAETFRSALGFRIEVSESLPDNQQAQALAHELAHLLLLFRGLSSVADSPLLVGVNSEVVKAINNSISHSAVIAVLAQEYSIPSELHLQLRRDGLAALRECAAHPRSADEAWFCGVSLYDNSRTVPGIEEEVLAITRLNPTVRRVYRAAEKHLGRVDISQPPVLQEHHLEDFLRAARA